MGAFAANDYLDLSHTEHRVIFDQVDQVWEALPKIEQYLQFRLTHAIHGELLGQPHVGRPVYVGPGTVIENGATILGPAWIGANCRIRSGCYIRENVILGNSVIAGNSCEFKNCLIFDEAQIPHFNYVGDSVLGWGAHLGAGVILSNVRLDRREIQVTSGDEVIGSGLRKFGAIVGDHAEVGCNAVLNPGSLIGRHSIVYPGCNWRGVLGERQIAKVRQDLMIAPRRD